MHECAVNKNFHASVKVRSPIAANDETYRDVGLVISVHRDFKIENPSAVLRGANLWLALNPSGHFARVQLAAFAR